MVDEIIAYCDSTYDEKRKVAGIGIVIQKGLQQKIISNWVHCPSNNYGELFAIYLGAILTHGKGTIYTDSECAISYIENRVKEKPRTKEQYYNHQMMKVLAYKVRLLNPKVCKVKAHTGYMKLLEIGNAMADLLAKQGRAKFYAKENLSIKGIKSRGKT